VPPAGRGLGHDRAGRDCGRNVGDRTARPGELEPGSFFDNPLYPRTARFARHEKRALPGGATLRLDRRFDPARGILHEVQRLRDDTGWGPARA
jgi:hypothetical protein